MLQRAAHNQGQVSEEDDYEVIGEHRVKEEAAHCSVKEAQTKPEDEQQQQQQQEEPKKKEDHQEDHIQS